MSESQAGDLPVGATVLLAAFEGWNDAGSAATQAVAYLSEVWDAEQVDELDPEEYHDFQVNRPVVGLGVDGAREITWPTTSVSLATAPDTGQGPTPGRRGPTTIVVLAALRGPVRQTSLGLT